MGYTHFWTKQKDPTPKQWNALTEAFRLIYRETQTRALPAIQFETDDAKPPQMDEIIRFNGVGKDGHETFMLDPNVPGFEFCKTALKPYDLWVVAALTTAHHFAPDCWKVSSDGDVQDWANGVNLVQQFFPKAKNPILARPEGD